MASEMWTDEERQCFKEMLIGFNGRGAEELQRQGLIRKEERMASERRLDSIWTNSPGVVVQVIKEDIGARIEFLDVEKGVLASHRVSSWRCDNMAKQLRECGLEFALLEAENKALREIAVAAVFVANQPCARTLDVLEREIAKWRALEAKDGEK